MKKYLFLPAIITGLGLVPALTPAAQASPLPDYYLGLGVRAFLQDPTSLVINSKAKLFDLGSPTPTLSARPAVMFSSDGVEARLPLTVDVPVAPNIYPYAGGGIAYNADRLSAVEPMVTGGLDIGVGSNLYLGTNLNLIFHSGGETDTEAYFTLNYAL
ncbi:MAG: hypothetical protein LVS60_04565 [Nodosilinea sp. LVE1205-7]|jgi:hypothetical protein